MDTAMPRTPKHPIHGNSKAFPRSVSGERSALFQIGGRMLAPCIDIIKQSFFLKWLQPETTETPPLVRLANSPPYSAVYNKLLEFPGCWCISIRAHSPHKPSLSVHVSVCLSFLHSLVAPVGSVSEVLQGKILPTLSFLLLKE